MKKIYCLQDLDCASCAAKMEQAIRKIDGVEACSVNFLTQKLTLECPEEKLPSIFSQAVRACKKIEPDCTIRS